MPIFNKNNNNKKDDNKPAETLSQIPAAPTEQSKQPAGSLDFNRYFLAERRIFLDNISYETTKPEAGAQNYRLTAKDTIVAQLAGNTGVKVTYNRTLKFDPDGPFTLSISFAVLLIFNPGTRDEVDWKSIDIAKEFQKNCGALIGAMMSRTSLLIAEITSSAGQPPVILGMPMTAKQPE